MKRVLLGVLLLGALTTTPAMADPAKDAARARFVEGIELYRKHDFEAARVAFTQAYSVLKQRDVLFNLAAAERDSSHTLDALRHYRALLTDPAIDAKSKEDVVKSIADLEAKTSRIKIKATAGAKLTVDGAKVEAEDAVDVLPGAHDIVATYEDGTTKKAQVATKPGETTDADVSSAMVPVPTATATTTAPPFVPPPSQTPKLVAGGTLLGVGVVGLVLGGVFSATSSGAASDAEGAAKSGPCTVRTSAACDDLRALDSKRNVFQTGAIVSFVAGATFLATGIGVLIWGGTSKKTDVALKWSPNGAGAFFSLEGRF